MALAEIARPSLTRDDLLKYPFTGEAIEYIRQHEINLDEFYSTEATLASAALNRAVRRVAQAILELKVEDETPDVDIEVLSYALALILVLSVGDDLLAKRYAEAEGKRLFTFLSREVPLRVLYIAESSFRMKIEREEQTIGGVSYEYKVPFTDYVTFAACLPEDEWRAVNRIVRKGYVLLQPHEIPRVVVEFYKARMYEGITIPARVPANLLLAANRIKAVYEPYKSKFKPREEYYGPIVQEAFPPCMRHALEQSYAGERLSHHGRFAMTTFLLHVGKSVEDVIDIFRRAVDFDERIARYQTEHLAGVRGGKTRYSMPACRTLKTQGVCYQPDQVCRLIRHPLSYYKLKIKRMKTKDGKR